MLENHIHFLVKDTTSSSDNPLRLERTYKMKTINNKIEQNKDQYNLDR